MSQPLAERYAEWAAALRAEAVPDSLGHTMTRLVLDISGLVVAARRSDYVAAVIASSEGVGACTVLGLERTFTAGDAALVAGTAAHGEDFDDTFEGTPVHVGAVLVPAVLATAEARGLSGADVLTGLVAGGELICRLATVAPTAIHRAGFHPTAVVGALGAATAVATASRLDARRIASALGIAGSMASGIIEYLAEGTWTKRLHPGWAALAGIRAARLAEAGFLGPRTVIEGEHGFFKGFADPAIPRHFDRVLDGLGSSWHLSGLAFKPYACGTMAQPFVDCAVALRKEGVVAEQIEEVVAEVGEGTVHRLWEPRPEKIAPSTPYSAKFSVPFAVAVGFVDGAAGLEQFTDQRRRDPGLLDLAAKVSYQIDPLNEYPDNYTGHLTVRLRNGRVVGADQPHLRGGRREPLDDAELASKFRANAAFGGWSEELTAEFVAWSRSLFDRADMGGLGAFRR